MGYARASRTRSGGWTGLGLSLLLIGAFRLNDWSNRHSGGPGNGLSDDLVLAIVFGILAVLFFIAYLITSASILIWVAIFTFFCSLIALIIYFWEKERERKNKDCNKYPV